MIDRAYVQRMARYNRWQNENLYGVANTLSDAERRQERGAWFGSIHKTLNHILWGDKSWMSRFTDLPRPTVGIPESVSIYAGLAGPEVRTHRLSIRILSRGPTASTMLGSPPIKPTIRAPPSANGRGRAGFSSPICSITRPITAARCTRC